MSNADLERRLAQLERLLAARRPVHVLVARDGAEAVALRNYEAQTPEPERAELVVVVRRFAA